MKPDYLLLLGNIVAARAPSAIPPLPPWLFHFCHIDYPTHATLVIPLMPPWLSHFCHLGYPTPATLAKPLLPPWLPCFCQPGYPTPATAALYIPLLAGGLPGGSPLLSGALSVPPVQPLSPAVNHT